MSSSIPLFDAGENREIAKRHCRQMQISIGTLEDLIYAELDQVGKLRKKGLWECFDRILEEEVNR